VVNKRARPGSTVRAPDKTGAQRSLKTLDRVISKAGLGSRTDARSWIGSGRIAVNGKVVENPDHWVDLDRDRVTLDGKLVRDQGKRYVLLYKPKGYVTTYKDPEGRPTVYDLLDGVDHFVAQVGRLDLDTSGLLLLTNDTLLAEALTNPNRHVPKTYLVKASGQLSNDQLESLRQGVLLDDGITRPAAVVHLRNSATSTFLEITITEGRNRQVRRMLEAIGSKVLKLVRVKLGSLTLEGLQIGKHRDLTPEEVKHLKTEAGMPSEKKPSAVLASERPPTTVQRRPKRPASPAKHR
jgi:23S rRNA pseudouridine2605 synthase